MSQRLLNTAAVVVMVCSLVATVVYVRSAWQRPAAGVPVAVTNTTRFVPNADRERAIGTRVGPAAATVALVEFTDLQCPACRSMDSTLRAMRARWPDDVAIVHRHFPLEGIHPHARAAAQAWECAGRAGRFDAFARVVYQSQDSLGVLPWSTFAARAQVADTSAFNACLAAGTFAEKIRVDAAAAERLALVGTPTIIVGDSAYSGRSLLALDSLVRSLASVRGRELQ